MQIKLNKVFMFLNIYFFRYIVWNCQLIDITLQFKLINMFDLYTMREQDIILQCPYCFADLSEKDIVGETEYDVVRIGHNIGGLAVVCECHECFEKSFLHKESLKWKIP